MAGAPTTPTKQELENAVKALRWITAYLADYAQTIDAPTGDGRPAARVDQTSPAHGRPSDGSPGAAEPPIGSPGDVPIEVDLSDNPTAEKARTMLRAVGYGEPGRVLAEYTFDRIIKVCEAAYRNRAKIKNLPAWINTALRRHWTV